MYTRVLKVGVRSAEGVVTVLLVALLALAIVGLVVDVANALIGHHVLDFGTLLRMIDYVLIVFVLVELIAIAFAYLAGHSIVATVLEATLVAVARNIIAFEPGEHALERGLALALLMLAVSVGCPCSAVCAARRCVTIALRSPTSHRDARGSSRLLHRVLDVRPEAADTPAR
jgi:uncharacterized membrane protein (DUF373 family)